MVEVTLDTEKRGIVVLKFRNWASYNKYQEKVNVKEYYGKYTVVKEEEVK